MMLESGFQEYRGCSRVCKVLYAGSLVAVVVVVQSVRDQVAELHFKSLGDMSREVNLRPRET